MAAAPFLFISITSHQNSSPSEVATVPLAIKIVLGHATPVCDSAVGNKSGGGGGNDADSRVVNLEAMSKGTGALISLGNKQAGPVYTVHPELRRNISNKDKERDNIFICNLC